MCKRTALLVLFTSVAAFATPVSAVETCSVGSIEVEKAGGYGRAVEAAVKAASNCDQAYQVLEDCQLGSSGDNALADIVQSKCESVFKREASATAKKAYKSAQRRCDEIAEKNEGSMYQGFAAICRAKAARDLARKH
jgi:hypothetical protein